MKVIDRFSVKEDEKLYSRDKVELYFDGKPVGLQIDGVTLRGQFESREGFLLITDNNDPWECIAHAALVDQNLKVLGTRTLGREGLLFPKQTFCPCDFEIQGEADLLIKGGREEGSYSVLIRPTSFLIRNPLKATFIPPT